MLDSVKNYRQISAEKKLQRQSKIPKEWLIPSEKYHGATNLMQVPVTCGVMTDLECEITSNYDATALLEKLKEGIWSAEQLTIAFCKRAAIAQQLVCHFQSCPCRIVFNSRLTLTIDQLFDRDLL